MRLTPVVGLHKVSDGLGSFWAGHAVEGGGIDHYARCGEGTVGVRLLAFGRADDGADGETVLLGELVVALVVGGDAHDDAGAVGGEDVVGDVEGYSLAVDEVNGVGAEGDAGLFSLGGESIDFCLAAGLFDVCLDGAALLRGGEALDEGVFRRKDHECDAVDGVDTGGEGANFFGFQVVVGDVEGDFDAFAAADPVALHGEDFLGPVDEAAEIKEFVGVLGNAEEPLLEGATGDEGVAAFAGTVDHLLVGEDGVAGGAPNYGGFAAVDQSVFVELEEKPLVPAIVFRQTGDDFAVPIVDGAHGAELAAHVFDVTQRPGVGVDAVADGGVFGGKAEGVEAHGVEDVEALHSAKAGVAVGGGHDVPVADVEVARGVGVHGKLVPLGAGVVVGSVVDAVLFPPLLPLVVDFLGGVSNVNASCGGHFWVLRPA